MRSTRTTESRTSTDADDPVPGGGWRARTLPIAAALTLSSVAFIFLWWTFSAGGEPGRTAAERSAVGSTWVDLEPGWTQLPSPPVIAIDAAWTWTGRELLAWGGLVDAPERDYPPTAEGFAYDPADGRWRPMPAAPEPRAGALALWTGHEVLYYGGTANGDWKNDGLAFDPETRGWRPMSPAPLARVRPAVTAWTGAEMIVWGGGEPEEPHSTVGAAYDPVSDSWRRVAEAPIGLNLASAAWSGRELFVFGSLLDNRNHAETPSSVGAAYDPVADSWRELPASDLSPQATHAAWVGGRLIAYDYEVRAQEYRQDADRWLAPNHMPLDFSECYPDGAVLGDVYLAWFCGQAATYDSVSGEWAGLHGGLLAETLSAHGRDTPLYRFASVVSADDVIVFAAEGITVDDEGVPCYGCPGSPTSVWAWRPA
jgi:hypothetical protein